MKSPSSSSTLLQLFDSDDAGAEECPVKQERKDEEEGEEDTLRHEGDNIDLTKSEENV